MPKSDHVTVHTRIPKKKFGWKDDVTVDYTVQVPEGARLDEISSVNGTIVFRGIGGDSRLSRIRHIDDDEM